MEAETMLTQETEVGGVDNPAISIEVEEMNEDIASPKDVEAPAGELEATVPQRLDYLNGQNGLDDDKHVQVDGNVTYNNTGESPNETGTSSDITIAESTPKMSVTKVSTGNGRSHRLDHQISVLSMDRGDAPRRVKPPRRSPMTALCGCFGVDRAPSIKHTTGEHGMPGLLEPDLPMPPEAELNQKFAELVDQLDLDRAHREVMFNLTSEKKWQLYCSKRREQDDMQEGPEPYIEQLNHLTQHNTLLLAAPNADNSEEAKLRVVDSLRTALRTQPISFVVGFIEKNGLESTLAFLSKMDTETLQSSLHTSVLGCVKALMNNSQGRSHVLAHPDAINVISQSLACDNLKTKTSCIEILGAMCLVPGGQKKVLGAMLHFQRYACERTRFQTIINDLDRSTGIYRDEVGIKSTIMSFINVILKYGSGQDSLDFRMHLRYEFLMLGLQPIVDKLRRHGNATLNKHIEFFELVRNTDEKDFSRRFDLLHVDTRSATNMFELLRKRLHLSTSYGHLLSVLKHLLLLPNQSKGNQYWSLIDRLIQQVCLQQKDGTNPDIDIAQIDVNKVVRQLAQESEVKTVQTQMRQLQKENDDLLRQLQKRERECEVKSQEKDELMSTVNEMKSKLEKETAEAANLTQEINNLKAQLIVEQQERQKLQHYVKTGNLPDDTKVGAILSSASLSPMPPMGAPPPPPAPGGPPPPPPPGAPPGPPAPPGMGFSAPTPPKQKKVPKPSIALKSFNWAKIPTEKTTNTVFEGLEDERLYKQLDLSDFETQFSAYQPKEGSEKMIVKQEPKELSLVDGRRAQNCTILLSKIKLSSEELRKAVLSVDRGEELAKDMVEQLLKFVPTAEESQMLAEHEKEREQMARADRFLLDISKVPHYEQRLKALYYKKKFNDRMGEAKPKIIDILEASKQLYSSRRVRRLLEVILAFGNYMNKGNRGNAFGFRMSSLNKIADTKSSHNRDFNFLNYLVQVFHRQFPQLVDLEGEIDKVKAAKKVALPELQKEVNKLGMELKEIRKEILYQKNHKTGDADDRFVQVMSDFVTVAEYKYSELESKYKEAMEKYEKVVVLYGEEKDKTAPDEFFGIFSDFLEAVDLAGAQNKRRELRAEEEKRRAAIDAKMKAERNERKNAERRTNRREAPNEAPGVAPPTEKGEFDDLISALRTGNVYDDDIMMMNKKGGGGRKRPNRQTGKDEGQGQSSSKGGYKSKYAQPII